MKKVVFTIAMICPLLGGVGVGYAQSGQKFASNGNLLSKGEFLGSTNDFPLVFKTNNITQMVLGAAGGLQVTNLAGVGTRFLQTDANGNLLPFAMGAPRQFLAGNGTWMDFPALPPTFWTGVSGGQQDGARGYIYYNAGTVGIGTATPNTNYALDVLGDANISGNLFVGGGIVIQPVQILPGPGPKALMIQAAEVQTKTINADTISMDSLAIVKGITTFADKVRLQSALDVVGKLNLRSALSVTGNAVFSGSLDAQRITFGGGQAGMGYVIPGNPVPTATLNTGNLVLSANTNVWGGLNVASLAGSSGGSFVTVDSLGNLAVVRGRNTSSVLIPCVVNTPWMLGGNNLGTLENAVIGTCDNNDLVFEANSKSYMWLKPSGMLGIGNPLPAAQLDITTSGTNAGLNINNSSNQSTFNVASNGNVNFSPTGQLFFNGDQDHGLGVYGTSGHPAHFVAGGELVNGPVLYGWGGGALGSNQTTSGGTTRNIALRWDDGGKIYIGGKNAGTYASALLHVNGDMVVGNNLGSAGIHLYQSMWSDFVFDNNYKPMPLPELEKYYKENHHLPNVPTAKDIKEKGNNLGETDAMLLQKTEENTLYIVGHDKEIKEVKKENKELKEQLEAQQKQLDEQKKLIDVLAKKVEEKK